MASSDSVPNHSYEDQLSAVGDQTSVNEVSEVSSRSQTIPQALKNRIIDMDGSFPRLLIKKSLTKNDIDEALDRLFLPLDMMDKIFLTLAELRLLESSKEKIDVVLLEDSHSERCVLSLKRRKSGSYELTHGWSSVVNRNQLNVGSLVQIYVFRVGPQLGFGLVILKT